MKIENTEVYGFKSALRAMRNPLDSWDKSDSYLLRDYKVFSDTYEENIEGFVLGNNDKILSQKLVKAGTEHCKHLRIIQVWFDLTLPRYVWTEFDTYQHVNKISCSTMHTLMKKPITVDMFEDGEDYISDEIINNLNHIIELYKTCQYPNLKTGYKQWTKSLLPESFLEKRTINTSYMTLMNIYKQRKNHELLSWHTICDWIKVLPYFSELTGIEIF